MRLALAPILALLAACTAVAPVKPGSGSTFAPRMIIVDERDVRVEQPPPHGAIGMSSAFRISDAAPGRTMEFRRRILHPGAAIGEHPIDHDEVYYVLSGRGEVVSNGDRATLTTGMAAYLYEGAVVGIRQQGEEPLDLIISYPLKAPISPPN